MNYEKSTYNLNNEPILTILGRGNKDKEGKITETDLNAYVAAAIPIAKRKGLSISALRKDLEKDYLYETIICTGGVTTKNGPPESWDMYNIIQESFPFEQIGSLSILLEPNPNPSLEQLGSYDTGTNFLEVKKLVGNDISIVATRSQINRAIKMAEMQGMHVYEAYVTEDVLTELRVEFPQGYEMLQKYRLSDKQKYAIISDLLGRVLAYFEPTGLGVTNQITAFLRHRGNPFQNFMQKKLDNMLIKIANEVYIIIRIEIKTIIFKKACI